MLAGWQEHFCTQNEIKQKKQNSETLLFVAPPSLSDDTIPLTFRLRHVLTLSWGAGCLPCAGSQKTMRSIPPLKKYRAPRHGKNKTKPHDSKKMPCDHGTQNTTTHHTQRCTLAKQPALPPIHQRTQGAIRLYTSRSGYYHLQYATHQGSNIGHVLFSIKIFKKQTNPTRVLVPSTPGVAMNLHYLNTSTHDNFRHMELFFFVPATGSWIPSCARTTYPRRSK